MEEAIKEILDNPYWASIIVFISQLVFIYFRTLNVIYTAERKIWPAILTGNAVGLSILLSFSIGTKSVLNGQPIPIILFLLGGSIGTYWGIKQNEKRKNKEKNEIPSINIYSGNAIVFCCTDRKSKRQRSSLYA